MNKKKYGMSGEKVCSARFTSRKVCNNYKGIKLMSHTMKIKERIIERRLKEEVIGEE